jgi:hypothetical protein
LLSANSAKPYLHSAARRKRRAFDYDLDDANRLRLTCAGRRTDLAQQRIEVREGLRLTFTMDDPDSNGEPVDLLVDGVTHFDLPASRSTVSPLFTRLRCGRSTAAGRASSR